MGLLPRQLAVVLFASTACGPSTAELFDGGTLPVGSFFPVAPPAEPAATAPVSLTPCPAGWRQTDPSQCDPWPDAGMASCPVDQAHFPGTAGCALVGTACGADEWASDLPATGRVLYVNAGAAGPGTGTRSDPYPTLAAAVAAATAGDVVALGKGTFTSTARLGAGVTLWGACVGQTSVQLDPASGLMGAIESTASGVVVRNLRVTAPGVGVALGLSSTDVRLQQVVIDHAVGQGVSAQVGAHLTLDTVVIRDTQPGPQGTFGVAIGADSGGQISGQRVVVSGARTYGVNASGAMTKIALQDFAVVQVRAQVSDNGLGYGVAAQPGTSVSLTRGIVDGAQGNGLLCNGATCELTDMIIARTLPSAKDPTVCEGIRTAGGSLHATRTAVVDNPGFGVLIGQSKNVMLTDFIVSGGTALSGGVGALTLLDGAAVTLTRGAILDNETIGIALSSSSTLTASDLTVSGTRINHLYGGTMALSVIESSAVVLTRATFTQNDAEQLLVGGAGVSLSASDLVVSDQHIVAGNEGGGGVTALDHATVSLTRAHIDGISASGLYANGAGTTLVAQDVAVSNMRLDGKNQLIGSAVVVGTQASLQADRLSVSASQTVGVQMFEGATATLHDVLISDTALPDCHAPAPCNGERNIGLLAESAATVTASSFLVLKNGIGVLVDHASADLADGEINGHDIGADVIDPAFDVARLNVRVVYRNNVRNLDATVVPLPAPPPLPQAP